MGNLFAIGDIHGQRPMLDLMIDRVPFQKTDEIVFIGDFIDRGPDSRGGGRRSAGGFASSFPIQPV